VTVHERAYRSLVLLYPKGFRSHYRDDLVQHFADLIGRDGARRAWTRTSVDLAVTVPRYRLETIMSTGQSTVTLTIIMIALAVAGVMGIMTGVYPGVLFLFVAVGVAVSQRSQLARSIRTPGSELRRRRLRTAAILAVTCVVTTTLMWFDLMGNEDWHGGKLMLYNAVFFATFVGALAYFVIGLLTPRSASQAVPAT